MGAVSPRAKPRTVPPDVGGSWRVPEGEVQPVDLLQVAVPEVDPDSVDPGDVPDGQARPAYGQVQPQPGGLA